MDDLFGSIAGLPLHPLVVHGVVVLLPLMAVVTVLVTFVSRWRGAAWLVVVANAGVTVMALVAKESGERLKDALPVESDAIDRHAELGDVLPLFALGLLVASVVAALLRSERPAALAGDRAGRRRRRGRDHLDRAHRPQRVDGGVGGHHALTLTPAEAPGRRAPTG